MRHDDNTLEFRAPVSGWLVASEKLALYPGWSVSIGGKRAGIFRADAVLGAVRVNAGDVVRAAYEAKEFQLGLTLFAVMAAAVIATELRYRDRTGGATPPVAC
jgi:hypothetical protein